MEKLLTDDMRNKMTENEIYFFYAIAHKELGNSLESFRNDISDFQKDINQTIKRLNRISKINSFIKKWNKYIPDRILYYLEYKIEEITAIYHHYYTKVNWELAELEKTSDKFTECIKEVADYFKSQETHEE